MILYLFIIICLIAIIILFSFRPAMSLKSKSNIKKFKVIFIAITSFLGTSLYINLSNYWIGDSVLEKMQTQTNIANREANEVAIIRELMLNLEKELINSPDNIETIIKLAETKFFLGYLDDSLTLYKKARDLSPVNIDIMKAEAQVRVLLEAESLGKETLILLNDILSYEPKNILALYILGNYEYQKKNFSKAYSMFENLKRLLNKDSQEYNQINNKILEMERINEK
ncbi:MAG: hypothetical protein CBC53_004100 [Alphaproteobacteria bacterium TMED93]|nr:MAG: hypothetical protein CBC53_004100 [Alphaproteobacteria bacterium TMED93]